MNVIINFAAEAEFPKRKNGSAPKVDQVRQRIATFVDGYLAARHRLPERVVLAPGEYEHCMRKILARTNREARAAKRRDWEALRKSSAKVRWRDVRPEAITEDQARLAWLDVHVEKGAGYSRHRSVDKAPEARHG